MPVLPSDPVNLRERAVSPDELDDRLRAARRSLVLLKPCQHCFMIPDEILARDRYGYPIATGETHEPGCPLHDPTAA